MEGASILELIAELAVALLGFSGIVVVIGGRLSDGFSAADRSRFVTMVLFSALVVVLALFPFALHHGGLVADTLWGWSSGVGTATCLFFQLAMRRATTDATVRIIWSDASVSKAAIVIGVASMWISILLLAANSAGILLERTFTPYLVSVLLLFGQSLFSFVRLLNTAFRESAGADPLS